MNGCQVWLGRVFTSGQQGGNHTAVVHPCPPADCFGHIASSLGVPDTGFVTGLGERSVRLRTYSPVEELAQCFQTSLAVLVAFGAEQGVPWQVCHDKGDSIEVVRDGNLCWARHLVDDPGPVERVDPPAWLNVRLGKHGSVIRFGRARPRLYVRCGSVEQLERITIDTVTVIEACAATRCNGLVCYAFGDGDLMRVRVFTTSLGGGEDQATGGAVLGIAILLVGEGHRGELDVVQGGTDPARQGRLRLRLDGDITRIMLGGQVHPILQGRLLAS